jgi:hypothetical protein
MRVIFNWMESNFYWPTPHPQEMEKSSSDLRSRFDAILGRPAVIGGKIDGLRELSYVVIHLNLLSRAPGSPVPASSEDI